MNLLENFTNIVAEMKNSSGAVDTKPVNIGVEYKAPPSKRNELLSVSLSNRKDKALEQAARLHKRMLCLMAVYLSHA